MNELSERKFGCLASFMYSLLQKDLLFQILSVLEAVGVKCCIAAVKYLPVLHLSAD